MGELTSSVASSMSLLTRALSVDADTRSFVRLEDLERGVYDRLLVDLLRDLLLEVVDRVGDLDLDPECPEPERPDRDVDPERDLLLLS